MKIWFGAVVSLATVALMLLPALASGWARAGSAPVHPGVQTHAQGAQCTSNGTILGS